VRLKTAIIFGFIGVILFALADYNDQNPANLSSDPIAKTKGMQVTKSTRKSPVKITKKTVAQRIMSESRAEQYRIFAVTVRSAGFKCNAVVRRLYVGKTDGKYFWSVMCSNGIDFSVSIESREPFKSRIMPCKLPIAPQVKICWEKFDGKV